MSHRTARPETAQPPTGPRLQLFLGPEVSLGGELVEGATPAAFEAPVLRPQDLSTSHGFAIRRENLEEMAAAYDPAIEEAVLNFDDARARLRHPRRREEPSMTLIVFAVVLLSAVLVAVDADRIRRERGLAIGPANQSPAVWGVATALLWIVVLPYYLIVRNRPVAANVKTRSTGAQIGRGCLFGILLLAAVAALLFGLVYLSGR